MRALTAVAELNQAAPARRSPPSRSYTDPDASAWFVREADEAISLGPATFVDPADGSRKSRYLDERAVLDGAARGAGRRRLGRLGLRGRAGLLRAAV